jgi:hypothetical protein
LGVIAARFEILFMGITTLLAYLVGNRQAILTIAGSRWALALGCLFVLSAGFAREYDGEDLSHEPWHVLIPLVVSLGAAFALFTFAFLSRGGFFPPFVSGYLSFLALFWMTAPMAWLYAVPYERFVDPVEAMRLNLSTLGLVSLWRVALMVRVLMVWFQFKFIWAACTVLFFADGVALLAVMFAPMPILHLMGGVRLAPTEAILAATAGSVFCFGGCTLPFWFVGWATAHAARPKQGQPAQLISSRPSMPLWLLAVLSVALWPIVLPHTQPEQRLRRLADATLRAGQIAEALELMSRHSPDDFPPHWAPPPHRITLRLYGNDPLLETWGVLLQRPTAPWVRALYVEKLRTLLLNVRSADTDAANALAELLVWLPEGEQLLAEAARERQDELPDELKAAVEAARTARQRDR